MDIDKDIKQMPKVKKKGEKKTIVTVAKIVAVIFLFLLQVCIMLALYSTARDLYNYARIIFDIIRLATVLYILYHHESAEYKTSWILFIMLFPVVGVLVYYFWGNSRLKKKKELAIRKVRIETENMLKDSQEVDDEIKELDIYKYNQVQYMTKITGYPVYRNEGTEYFEIGEKFFESLKKDLEKAQKYILMEFFIVSKGKLLDEVLEILKRKAKAGVKVELMVDALGCICRLPKGFEKQMEEAGIEFHKFNPFTIIINGYVNYRDHRKIIVIDGKIGYTGGVNLADEYANIIERFGHWKDGGIKVIGKATWSYTLMFLRTKEQLIQKEIDYLWYRNTEEADQTDSKGYVLPIADGPDNRKNPIENIYIQTINYAKDYVYITTPYFVVSQPLLMALLNSARSGVDVRLITPHIPDKKAVQIATRSYYEVLLEAGVKVYEYKPGFIHSKTFVADDTTAIVGTANLDFRSAHLNFECINWMYVTGEEIAVKEDFENMLGKCIKIELDKWQQRPWIQKILEAILSAFSPML